MHDQVPLFVDEPSAPAVPPEPEPEPEPAAAPAPEVAAPEVEIRVSARRRKTVGAHWEGDRIVVVVPARLSKADRRAYADELAARLIAGRERRRPTDAALTERAMALSRQYLGGEAVPASVAWSSRQNTRWGSCSPDDRTIRISARLQDVPGWVLDTVVLHELAHLIHPGHTPAFHALVGRHPRLAEADAFLAGYAHGLDRARR